MKTNMPTVRSKGLTPTHPTDRPGLPPSWERVALKAAEMVGIPRLSVVNVVGSAIARETKMGVYLNAGRETAVASTKAFTTQVGARVMMVWCVPREPRAVGSK